MRELSRVETIEAMKNLIADMEKEDGSGYILIKMWKEGNETVCSGMGIGINEINMSACVKYICDCAKRVGVKVEIDIIGR